MQNALIREQCREDVTVLASGVRTAEGGLVPEHAAPKQEQPTNT